MGIRVRAINPVVQEKDVPPQVVGYYDHKRRRSGDEFEIEKEADFSKKWMEKISVPADDKSARGPGRPPKAGKKEA